MRNKCWGKFIPRGRESNQRLVKQSATAYVLIFVIKHTKYLEYDLYVYISFTCDRSKLVHCISWRFLVRKLSRNLLQNYPEAGNIKLAGTGHATLTSSGFLGVSAAMKIERY